MQLTESALRQLVAQVIKEEEGNITPMAGDSMGDTQIPEPADDLEKKQTSDIELVKTHLQKINNPQEQIQIVAIMLDMLMGRGDVPDQLSKEQRVQAIRNALEDDFGTKSGPLVSAIRNLLMNIE